MNYFKLLICAFSFLMLHPSSAQVDDFNLDSVGSLDYGAGVNDIWGYVDSDGTEYAIMGTEEGTAVISLEAPSNPTEVYFVSGANSNWRDMKTHGDYAYSVADQGEDGLLIIDMSRATQDSFEHFFYQPSLEFDGLQGTLRQCHNIYIDDSGYCYLTGCDLNNGGTIIFDLNVDPMEPELVGKTPSVYAHDCYASDDRLYTADIYAGQFSVYDISTISNPQLLARQNTSSRFTHNVWPSDDGNYLFTTDEEPNAFVDAYDISNLDNIERVDAFKPESTKGQGVIPHNTHYFNGYLVTSWYTDGVKIIDAHNPDNLVEVGSYDTYPGPSGGFNGCWGAYPYLPSGLILASDRSSGLYVLDPNYVRASYVEGLVTDSVTGSPISEAILNISSTNPTEVQTNSEGRFKTGISQSGSYEIEVDHPFYEPKIVTVNFSRGDTKSVTVELNPLYASHNIVGEVISKKNGSSIENASVSMDGTITSYIAKTNNSGQFEKSVFEDTYEIFSGKWGYRENQTIISLEQDESIVIELEDGYKDDFVLDLGWTVEGNAVTGGWERGIPSPETFENILITPPQDVEGDLGSKCYVTQLGGDGPGSTDIDNGITRLVSPSIPLDEFNEPKLTYAYWFVNVGGGFGTGDPNDTLKVLWTDGTNEYTLNTYTDTSLQWMFDTVDMKSVVNNFSDGQIVFSASDFVGTGHIVEAGIDAVQLYDANPDTATAIIPPPADIEPLTVYPNPTSDMLLVHPKRSKAINSDNSTFRIVDVQGQTVLNGEWNNESIRVGTLESGMYYIILTTAKGTQYRSRFIVQ